MHSVSSCINQPRTLERKVLSGIKDKDVSLTGGASQTVTISGDKCWHRNSKVSF